MGFCYEDELLMGDFDADGRSDLVCRKDGGAEYQIALSGGKIDTVWCLKEGEVTSSILINIKCHRILMSWYISPYAFVFS